VQIVLSLVTSLSGLPISYNLFPGNIYEGHTLFECVKDLKKHYKIQNILLVADRGMFNENNLELMDKEKIKYIVGAKLKTLKQLHKDKILDELTYYKESICDEDHLVSEFEYKSRRLIVSYSEKRLKKDASDRQRLLDRLLKKTKNNKIKIDDLIANYGTKKYLTKSNDLVEINQEKIEKDARWDGISGVITNLENKTLKEILERYRNLWQIEEAFRINKHNLKMRPIYHHKPRRIKAHISICFLAYSVLKTTEFKLKKNNTPMSIETIRGELQKVQTSYIESRHDSRKFAVPSIFSNTQKQIYGCFDVYRREDIYNVKK